jgi:hypothetical protein
MDAERAERRRAEVERANREAELQALRARQVELEREKQLKEMEEAARLRRLQRGSTAAAPHERRQDQSQPQPQLQHVPPDAPLAGHSARQAAPLIGRTGGEGSDGVGLKKGAVARDSKAGGAVAPRTTNTALDVQGAHELNAGGPTALISPCRCAGVERALSRCQ